MRNECVYNIFFDWIIYCVVGADITKKKQKEIVTRLLQPKLPHSEVIVIVYFDSIDDTANNDTSSFLFDLMYRLTFVTVIAIRIDFLAHNERTH